MLSRLRHSIRRKFCFYTPSIRQRKTKHAVLIRLDTPASKINNIARRKRNLQTPNEVSRRSILECTRARCVRRNRPAKITTPLCGVGRIDQPLLINRALKIREHHSGFRRRPPFIALANNLSDSIQTRSGKNNASEWHTPADNPCARACDRNRHALARSFPKHICDLLCILRKDNTLGMSAPHVACIREVRLNLVCVLLCQHKE